MARRNPSSMSEDGQVSEAGPITPALAESLERTEMLREQLKTSERLNEYYNEVVAELRASLDKFEEGEQAS
ncbi:hypothetical protein [Bradyrhizobium sp.]|jgi:hypothetical protein|uniref:hypothetical protein n=1 Tax=Bradyrhizobium sp. TaxID=376 RepID=UPI003C44F677